MFLLKKDINIQIGQRVHKAREQANLSRDELAERLNISSLFLGYIECGQKGMSLTTLKNLCTLLGVSADYILLGVENSNIHQSNVQLMISNLDQKYLPVIESQLKSFIHSIEEIENLNQDKKKGADS